MVFQSLEYQISVVLEGSSGTRFDRLTRVSLSPSTPRLPVAHKTNKQARSSLVAIIYFFEMSDIFPVRVSNSEIWHRHR